ncbi:unnamed protein product [Caenorhabditis angaria]|uniref:ABC-type uncharacterized transport system domain-containing protein n=1 Tax=Caenorhabditis angaria TaxID=860376 RepID=A0A9P1N8D6_9PELO|nr:unnamed protein product [Caenorhabditis angaria]
MPPFTENKGRVAPRKVLIDQSKQQQISLISGFRGVARHLKSLLNVEINTETLNLSALEDVRMLIIPQPKTTFGPGEIETIWKFVEEGGSLMILSGENGEKSTLNDLLTKYGITLNKDAVIRTVFYKYFDPKEALITNGIVNRSIASAAKKNVSLDQNANSQTLSFVYPFGCTLNVNKSNSTIVMSSGAACFPAARPIVAFHETKLNENKTRGRVCVVGSVSMFHDAYIDKEENGKIFDVLIEYLMNGFELNSIDAAEPEINDYINIPDHVHMSNQLKVCLYEGELDSAISTDFMKILDTSLHSFSLKHWPATLKLYDALHLSPPPLTLVEPQFELPLPPLEPAVFPPNFHELPPPELELFDLDELFSSAESRLSQLANKCDESDVDYFILEASVITGIHNDLPVDQRKNPKKILETVMYKLLLFKRSLLEDQNELEVAGMYDVNDNYPNPMDSPRDYYNQNPEDEGALFSDIDEFDDL